MSVTLATSLAATKDKQLSSALQEHWGRADSGVGWRELGKTLETEIV